MSFLRPILLLLSCLLFVQNGEAASLPGAQFDATTLRFRPTSLLFSNIFGVAGVTVHYQTNGTLILSNTVTSGAASGVDGLANSNLTWAVGLANSNLSYALALAATNYSLAASNGARLAAGLAASNHAAAILQSATNYADSVGAGGSGVVRTNGNQFGATANGTITIASGAALTNANAYGLTLPQLVGEYLLASDASYNLIETTILFEHAQSLLNNPNLTTNLSGAGNVTVTSNNAGGWTITGSGTAATNYTDNASSNRVVVVAGTGGITVTTSGSGGVQTFTVNDDDAGGGGSAAGTNNLIYAVDSGVLGILQTNGTDSALALITAVLTPGLGTAQVKGVVESNGVFMFALSSKATGLDGLVKESALFMPVPPGARYYWTNLSTGSGATAAILTNTHWRVRIQTAGTNTGSGGGPITPWTSTIDGAGYNLTNAGSADIAAVALPVSLLFGGGSASRWTTNLSAHALIVPTNLVAGRRYEVTIVSAGFSAVVSNSAAIRWTDGAFDGNCSTNGTTTLTVWKDLVTGFTNGIVEGPEFTFVPGSDVVMTTNFLARTVTLNGVFTETAIATNTTPATNSALSWAVSQQTQFHLQSSHFYLTNHTGRAAGSVANGTIYLSCTNGGTTTLIFPTLGAASGFPTNASQPLINIVTNAVTVALSWSRRGTNVHLSTTAWR